MKIKACSSEDKKKIFHSCWYFFHYTPYLSSIFNFNQRCARIFENLELQITFFERNTCHYFHPSWRHGSKRRPLAFLGSLSDYKVQLKDLMTEFVNILCIRRILQYKKEAKLLTQDSDISNTDIISKRLSKTRSNHIDPSNVISNFFFRILQCRCRLQALVSSQLSMRTVLFLPS